ncbi:MAG: integration host factor subunit alpha [Pseudomonadota bacterium]
MPQATVTRADLTDAIYRSIGVSRHESAIFVERIVEEICSALERGEQVKISSFGTFTIREKKMRMGRNPKTGEEVPITPRRVISFRASNVLKEKINDNLAGGAASHAAE